jgi:23S rRNA C2498 (ribose-2'-O)-methylase RlmM
MRSNLIYIFCVKHQVHGIDQEMRMKKNNQKMNFFSYQTNDLHASVNRMAVNRTIFPVQVIWMGGNLFKIQRSGKDTGSIPESENEINRTKKT